MFANLNRVAAISSEPGKRTVVVALPLPLGITAFPRGNHRVAAISSEPGKRTVVVALPLP
ncbi:hypothetical protein KAM369_01680 [Aeromonas caviae]|nr:hypothetical protein KAM355_13040 [Aeromonas caviae]GJA98366.1 hypothetical protein KAM359_17740 [Aeromonas caviae]GJB39693.1 hypothetical protein KAM369_01680 [Aeromonas caviae]GJB71471.1 hypothetical protein KAM379_05290 [Aeromonas caviae]GJC17185.1 hypothetical protein KAM377_06670 [Aeromonas caviae]